MDDLEHEWEVIDSLTSRMKVHGGWIYRCISNKISLEAGVALVFVPE